MTHVVINDMAGIKICTMLKLGKKEKDENIYLTIEEAENLIEKYTEKNRQIDETMNNYRVDAYGKKMRIQLLERNISTIKNEIELKNGNILKLDFDMTKLKYENRIILTNTMTSKHGNDIKIIEAMNENGEFETIAAKLSNTSNRYMNFIEIPRRKPTEEQKRKIANLYLRQTEEHEDHKPGNNVCKWAFEGETKETIIEKYSQTKKDVTINF